MEVSSCARMGRLHDTNEDSHHVDVRRRIIVLADGMGGHRAGEVASTLAVRAVAEHVHIAGRGRRVTSGPANRSIRSRLRNSILSADELLLQAQREQPEELGGMGCALVAVRWGRKYWHIAHVGDTRVYAYSEGTLRQLTHDHTAVSDLVRAGYISAEDAARHPLRHHLTQAVGHGGIKPESLSIPIVVGREDKQAWLVVCSDGVWDTLGEKAMLRILSRSRSGRNAARRLVRTAWQNDGRDDCTAVVIGIHELSETPRSGAPAHRQKKLRSDRQGS